MPIPILEQIKKNPNMTLTTVEKAKVKHIALEKAWGINYNSWRGPEPYAPYPGGRLGDKPETLSVKPGFKIWVDQATLDYPESTCLAKKLDCKATCCM